jgi:hypothetical protein
MLTVLLLLTATQVAAEEPVKLASMGFGRVKVPAALVTSFEETFALRLDQTKLVRVTTPRDVASVIGADRQRKLLGCADESTSCLAELAGALGAEGLITGEVAQVGKRIQLTIKILSPQTGQPLFTTLERFKDEEDVLEALDRAALEAAKLVHATLRPPKPKVVVAPPTPVEPTRVDPPAPTVAAVVAPAPAPSLHPRLIPWLVTGVGAAVLIAGGVVEGLAASDYFGLKATTNDRALQGLRDAGKEKQTIGLSLLGAGGLVGVAGLIWALATPVDQPRVTTWLSTTGGGVLLSGDF